jgi:hypothetical protein
MNYSDKLKDPRWQKKRLEILQRDDFTCQFCHDKETPLHVHHLKYTNEPWEAPNEDIITLCEHCHDYIGNVNELYSLALKVKKIVFPSGEIIYLILTKAGLSIIRAFGNESVYGGTISPEYFDILIEMITQK